LDPILLYISLVNTSLYSYIVNFHIYTLSLKLATLIKVIDGQESPKTAVKIEEGIAVQLPNWA
jgi:hypothetical protein